MASKKSKEIKITVDIGEADRVRKAKQALKFLEKGLGVRLSLTLRRRDESRTGHAMSTINTFIADTGLPENKVNPLKWNGSTLQTFLHP